MPKDLERPYALADARARPNVIEIGAPASAELRDCNQLHDELAAAAAAGDFGLIVVETFADGRMVLTFDSAADAARARALVDGAVRAHVKRPRKARVTRAELRAKIEAALNPAQLREALLDLVDELGL